MSWQDDLRQLDSSLAEGRISAEDYRRRRDEVLSSASGSDAAPSGQPQQNNPFGQPFRWEAGPPAAGTPNADATQVVGSGPNPDATQVVNNQQGNKDAERTQIVRSVTPPPNTPNTPGSGWPNTPSQPQPPQQQPAMGTPPWGGSNDMYSPMDQNAAPGWIAQGPEVFEEKSSSTGKRVLAIVGVVVLLAAIGAGVWFFVQNQGGGGNEANGGGGGDTTTAAPTTTTKPRPTDPNEILLEQIPDLVGKRDAAEKVLAVDELATQQVMSADEAELLTDGKVTKVAWSGASKVPAVNGQGAEKFSVVVIPTADDGAATALMDQLLQFQESTAFIRIDDTLPNMPKSVVFEKKVSQESADYRGIYTSGKNVIRVVVQQTPLVDEAALSGSYQNQIKALFAEFPAVQ
jgi:hypothetical protein